MNSNRKQYIEQNCQQQYQKQQSELLSQGLLEITSPITQQENQASYKSQVIKLNKIDIRLGDFQRQQWILQDKFSQKSVQQSLNSIDQDNFQHQKDDTILKDEYSQDQNIAASRDEKYNKNLFQQNEEKNCLNESNIQKNLESSSAVIKVRQGRKTIFRPKRDESIVDSAYKKKKTKKVEQQNKLNYYSERDLDHQRDDVLSQESKHKNKKEKVWISRFFNILLFVNRFLVRNRQKLLFFHPNQLQSHQAEAINDVEGCTYICLWLNPLGISLLRMFFLVKFIQLYDTIEKLAEAFQLSYKYHFVVNLVVLFIEVVLLCHLFACIWYSIGNYEFKNGLTPNWIQKYSADDNNQYQQYIDSIYFSVVTIGTIGFGDIVPVSILEKSCLTAMSIFSCGIFAYILSNIQNVYREYQMKQEGYNNKLSELNNYMFNREVNPTLQQMARKYLKYVHDQGFQQGVMPCETLNSLSISLREEIKEDIFKKSIDNIKFLQQFSPQLRFQLSRKMIEINYGPDEFIMKSGEFQQPRLYYILKGQVDVCLDKQNLQQQNSLNSQVFSLQKQTDIIGLFEFTTQTQLCMTNARSVGVTTVHVLALDDFLEAINQNSSDKEIYFHQKDLINLYKNYEQTKLFCYSCKSSQHLIKDCPVFFYKPNKQKIINKHVQGQNYLRMNIRNKQNSRFNSLAIVNQLRQDILQFCEENESDIDSLYQSQSTLKDTLQNIDVNDCILAQQSSLSPLKPKSEVNLRMAKDRNQEKDDIMHIDDEFKKKQSEKSEKQSKLNAIQQEASFLECCKLNEDFKLDSLLNQNFICSEQNIAEKQVDKRESIKNNEIQAHRSSFNNCGLVSKKNSFMQINNIHQSQLSQRISMGILDKNINLINQKAINENIMSNKEKQKYMKSLQSLKTQNIQTQKRNSIRYSQIQNFLNLLTSNIIKKENNPQEEIQEELIIDTIRIYKYYMPNNNAFIVIKKYNKYQNKKKEREKQKLLEIVSNNLQHRSIFQKF